MKKLIIVTIALMICSGVLAQRYYGIYYHTPYSPVDKDLLKEFNVCEFTSLYLNGKKESKGYQINGKYYLNTEGNISRIEYYAKGKLSSFYVYTYNEAGLITTIYDSTARDKCRNRSVYEFNPMNMIVRYDHYKNEEQNPSYYSISEYDSSRPIRTDTYKKGKLTRSSVYTYYPDRTLEKFQIYNGKGKLKHTTSYACRPEGEKISPHKDTTLVCKISERDTSGNLLEVYEYTNEKNKRSKYIFVYTPDTLFFESRTYNDKDILTHLTGYIPHKRTGINYGSKIRYSYSYNKKGKFTYSTVYTYDPEQRLLEKQSYKGKNGEPVLESLSRFTYNDIGLPVVTESVKDLKLLSKRQYEYKFREE